MRQKEAITHAYGWSKPTWGLLCPVPSHRRDRLQGCKAPPLAEEPLRINGHGGRKSELSSMINPWLVKQASVDGDQYPSLCGHSNWWTQWELHREVVGRRRGGEGWWLWHEVGRRMEPWRRKLREQVGRYELTTLYSCMKLSKNKFKTLNINYYITLFPRNTKKKKVNLFYSVQNRVLGCLRRKDCQGAWGHRWWKHILHFDQRHGYMDVHFSQNSTLYTYKISFPKCD